MSRPAVPLNITLGRGARWLIAALLVLLGSTGLYGAALAGEWLVITADVGPPDGIVVLASHEWERLPAAAQLAQQYSGAQVLLTLPGTVNEVTCSRCGQREWSLIAMGVSSERITMMTMTSSNTFQEAASVREHAEAVGLRRLVVVTSPYHTRRALATFRHVFRGTSILVGVHPATAHSRADPRSWWRESGDRDYVRYEIAASIAYWFRYRISVLGIAASTPAGNR